MKTLFLVGGLGTRLHPVVADRPKPMADIHGKPFLEYLIEQLRDHGFADFVFCVAYLAHQIQDYFGDGRRWGVQIAYAVETERLGTAGALKNAERFVQGTFLVVNGDTYLDVDFQALTAFHQQRQQADDRTIGTIAARFVDDTATSGALDLDDDWRILRFQEKAHAGPGRINGGIYVLEPEMLDLIPAGRAIAIEKETFPLVLKRDRHLYGFPVEGFFVDIGTPEGYLKFRQYVNGKRGES